MANALQEAPATSASRGTPLIEMRGISIAFGGIKAVDRASVDLYPGEVVGLLGHNGAGKSTLIKILSGAYKRNEGQIFIDGRRLTSPILAMPRHWELRRSTKHWRLQTMLMPLPTFILAAS